MVMKPGRNAVQSSNHTNWYHIGGAFLGIIYQQYF